jgi:hypothetical protein
MDDRGSIPSRRFLLLAIASFGPLQSLYPAGIGVPSLGRKRSAMLTADFRGHE